MQFDTVIHHHWMKNKKKIVCQLQNCFPDIKLVYMYLANFLHHVEDVTNSLIFFFINIDIFDILRIGSYIHY